MSAALSSPSAILFPPSPRGPRVPLTVEALQDLLGGLLRERELLRAGGAKRSLDRNRREIVSAQWQLNYALIARHGR